MYLLKESIKEEFTARFQEYHLENTITRENYNDWHYIMFNQDYYIIGYYKAEMWLKKHNIDVLEAIELIYEHQQANYEFRSIGIQFNYEYIVNMFTCIISQEWMNQEFTNLQNKVFIES